VGKGEVVELAIGLLARRAYPFEDVPGLGKTVLAKSLARSLGCSFRRIQCTPDLMPSDITGTYIFNQKTADFEFRAGPVMSQVVLADEINRATRTQSAPRRCRSGRLRKADPPCPVLPGDGRKIIELEGTTPPGRLDRFSEDKIITHRNAYLPGSAPRTPRGVGAGVPENIGCSRPAARSTSPPMRTISPHYPPRGTPLEPRPGPGDAGPL
jgi:hypothetical protein